VLAKEQMARTQSNLAGQFYFAMTYKQKLLRGIFHLYEEERECQQVR
jgi:hypothetical protein